MTHGRDGRDSLPKYKDLFSPELECLGPFLFHCPRVQHMDKRKRMMPR
jgi:hypothetical protein